MNPDPQALQAITDLIAKEQGFKDGHAANVATAQGVIQQAADAVTAAQQAVVTAQANAAAVAEVQQATIATEQNAAFEDQQIIDGLNALLAQVQTPAQA